MHRADTGQRGAHRKGKGDGAVTFAILIIVLLFKPTGFLGRKVQEKV